MALTLADFRAISNGTHNVGQITLNKDGDGLQKINNHVWKTSQNNVQSSAVDNRLVRQALYDAFSRAGNLSEAMLNDIRTILLGGTNGSRSLSRDFVKQLINTVETTREQNADLVGKMNFVSKSLSERKIKVFESPNELVGLVTSSKAAAYETYASEKMDICASQGQEGLEEIKNIFSQKERTGVESFSPDILRASFDKIRKSLIDMLNLDKPSLEYVSVSTKLEEQFDERFLNYKFVSTSHLNGLDGFIKSTVSRVYAEYGVWNLAADHLARIFPPDEPMPENIGQNQNEEEEQVDENQENQLNVQGDNDIQRPAPEDFDKSMEIRIRLSASLKDWFVKFASVENEEHCDDQTRLKGSPSDFYDEISSWISTSKIFQNLSPDAKVAIVLKFDNIKLGLKNVQWSDYQSGNKNVGGGLGFCDSIHFEIESNLNDMIQSSETLTEKDKNMLAQTFNCDPNDAAEKLSRYFLDELDKLGVNPGVVGGE